MLAHYAQVHFTWRPRTAPTCRSGGCATKPVPTVPLAGYAVLTQEDTITTQHQVDKATAQREATREWALERRARFGVITGYDPAALALGLVERRTIPNYRTRFPLWQKVLFLAQHGIRGEKAAAVIGTDPQTVARELPLAYAHLEQDVERMALVSS